MRKARQDRELRPLKKLLYMRIAFGVSAFTVGMLLFFLTGDIVYCIPFAGMSVLLFAAAATLAYAIRKNNFIRVIGICTQIRRAKLFGRIKEIYMQTDESGLRIIVRRRIRGIKTGKPIALFLAKGSRLYEKDGHYIVCNYYDIEGMQD